MFPSLKQFKKWTLPTKWGFVGSLLGVLSVLCSVVLFVVPHFAPPPSHIIGNLGAPVDSTMITPSAEELDQQGKQLLEKLEASAEADLEFYSETLAHYERIADEARDRLASICQFTEGSGVNASDNATVFFQKYNGLAGHPRLGDSLIKSLEGKLVEWALRVTKIHISEDGFAYILFEPATDPCLKGGCPKNSFISSVIQLAPDNNFVQEIRVGNYFRLSGILRLWNDPPGKSYPLTTRMTIEALNIEYRRESLAECLDYNVDGATTPPN